MPATVNTEINGWCPECSEWSVRGRHGQCMWCDTPLRNGPPEQIGGRPPRELPDGLVERAWGMYEAGWAMRPLAEELIGETTYESVGSFRNRLTRDFDAHGWERRERQAAVAATLVTHGMYVGKRRDKINARRRQVRAPRKQHCAGIWQEGTPYARPCKRFVAEGDEYCWWHDPAHAEARAEQTRQMRALRGARAGTTTEGGPDGPRDHREGHDDERPQAALARAGGGARNEAA